jgi:hypothetical protein
MQAAVCVKMAELWVEGAATCHPCSQIGQGRGIWNCLDTTLRDLSRKFMSFHIQKTGFGRIKA